MASRRDTSLRFLADENIPLESVHKLVEHGIDIRAVAESTKGITDERVLGLANAEERILLTFDQDFGELAFRRRLPSRGIVLLKFEPSSVDEVTSYLTNLLRGGVELSNKFTVIEKHRIRTFPFP